MSASSGSAVYGDCDLPLLQSEDLGDILIEDLVHNIDLQEVVPRTKGSQLRYPSLPCFIADLGRVRGFHLTAFLGDLEVPLPTVSVLYSPA